VIVGFRSVLVKPFGPIQEYVAPATLSAVSSNVCPAHRGELLVNTGEGEIGFTVILANASVSLMRVQASPSILTSFNSASVAAGETVYLTISAASSTASTVQIEY